MSHVFGRILSEIFDDSALFARRVSYSHSCSRIRISENLKKFGEEKFVIIICCDSNDYTFTYLRKSEKEKFHSSIFSKNQTWSWFLPSFICGFMNWLIKI